MKGRMTGRGLLALAIGAVVAAGVLATDLSTAEAGVLGPKSGDIGSSKRFGIGGHVGASLGPSAKLFVGGGLALQLNLGVHRFWYNRPGLRAEFDLMWHFSVYTHEKFEMLIGPGFGGGVGWWRHNYFRDFCGDPRNSVSCFGPFGRVFFHWSMAFHQWSFDIFAEPGIVLAFLPRFIVDFDFILGARYYF